MDLDITDDELVEIGALLMLSQPGRNENAPLANRDAQYEAMLENVSVNGSPAEVDAIADGLFEIIPRHLFVGVSAETLRRMIRLGSRRMALRLTSELIWYLKCLLSILIDNSTRSFA